MIKDLILKNRSYRRFYQDFKIEKNDLYELVDLARLSPSPKNKQILKFMICNDADKNEQIFRQLAWAGYLLNWNGPEEGEKPSAYIIVLGDSNLSVSFEADYTNTSYGICCQSILLGAVEKELGGCIIASIKRENLKNILNLKPNFEILCVIALGKPKEEVIIDELVEGNDIRYWRDENKIHHVPKRKLEDIIVE